MPAICEACRKADAVFPFVKSSFWKAVTMSMALAGGSRGVEGGPAQHTHTNLTPQHWIGDEHADAAKTSGSLSSTCQAPPRPQS